MSNIAAEIVEKVRAVMGPGQHPLQAPAMRAGDSDLVKQCVDTEPFGYGYIADFERAVAAATGSPYVIAVASGTAALHLALVAAGVRPGDEVIVPSLTFVASANAICLAGAKPRFLDVESERLGLSPERLLEYLRTGVFSDGRVRDRQTHRRIAAIMPVHLLGIPCYIEELRALATGFGIPMIEDAAEALGSWPGQRSAAPLTGSCGTWGRVGALSFNCNKIVSTGGGGAVLCNDAEIAQRVLTLATTAKRNDPFLFSHTEIAFNYRMPNVCAALGLPQMRRLDATLEAKRQQHADYCAIFGADMIDPDARTTPNHWLNAIRVKREDRDDVLRALNVVGLAARALFTPLHTLPMFSAMPRQRGITVATELHETIVCLPSTPRTP